MTMTTNNSALANAAVDLDEAAATIEFYFGKGHTSLADVVRTLRTTSATLKARSEVGE
jgi:ABC-type transporter Mla subunit MlaD